MRVVYAALALVASAAVQPDPAQAHGGCAVFARGHYDCGQAKYHYGSPVYRDYAPAYAYRGGPAVVVAVPPPPPVIIYVAPRTYDRYYSYYAAPEPVYVQPRRSWFGRQRSWHDGGYRDAGYGW